MMQMSVYKSNETIYKQDIFYFEIWSGFMAYQPLLVI